jgi:hypothetical protein
MQQQPNYVWKLEASQICLVLPKDRTVSICAHQVQNDIYREVDGFWHLDKLMGEGADLGDAELSPCIVLLGQDGVLRPHSIQEVRGGGIDIDIAQVFR